MKPDTAFDARLAAKKLLREGRSGALATLMPGTGDPYCSLVNVATAASGAPLMLLSQLAIHTKNILADNRDFADAGRAQGGRSAARRARDADGRSGRGALFFCPNSLSSAPPGGRTVRVLHRLRVLSSGDQPEPIWSPASAASSTSPPQDILTDVSDAQALLDAQADAIAHMNADHAEACRLYATKLLGAPDGDWRCAGIDPEGIELQNGRMALRLFFPQRVTAPGPLRAVLKQLAEQARGV